MGHISLNTCTTKYFFVDFMKKDWSNDEIKGKIFYKLTRRGNFKHSHTSIDNLPKGFPAHIRGKVKECIKELSRGGFFVQKPTAYGRELSINSVMRDRIMAYIKIFQDSEDD